MIRVETPADHAAVRRVHRAAFGGDEVPALVEALRASAGFVPGLSLVADDGAVAAPDVVGHVLLSWIALETAPGLTRDILCLSPLSVRPDAQGRGVGRSLVEAGCAAAQRIGEPLVVLEGDPRRYSRFGFVTGSSLGLRQPSERTPPGAFQVRTLRGYEPGDPSLRGRVLYPDVFWDTGSIGLPIDGPAFVDTVGLGCRDVERRTAQAGPAALATPVPGCPGWTVADVLEHLGVIHRFVGDWVVGGRRPTRRPERPGLDADLPGWFAAGWRDLHDLLADRPAGTPTATWSPWDASCGFWRRRMAHEAAVHAFDVAGALPDPLGDSGPRPWSVPDDVALDGVDEAVRLWLGTRLADGARGDGSLVRLVAAAHGGAPQRFWTVGLHDGMVETHELDIPPDATVTADPVTLYRWVWGRAHDAAVTVDGPRGPVEALRAGLARAMQ